MFTTCGLKSTLVVGKFPSQFAPASSRNVLPAACEVDTSFNGLARGPARLRCELAWSLPTLPEKSGWLARLAQLAVLGE